MAPDNTALFITTAGGLLGLLIQGWMNNRAAVNRATEHREQTVADSLLAKEEREKMAAELALTVQRQANAAMHASHESALAMMSTIDLNSKRINEGIAENTSLTIEAKEAAHASYVEANTVNQKIASIGLEMKDGKPLSKG